MLTKDGGRAKRLLDYALRDQIILRALQCGLVAPPASRKVTGNSLSNRFWIFAKFSAPLELHNATEDEPSMIELEQPIETIGVPKTNDKARRFFVEPSTDVKIDLLGLRQAVDGAGIEQMTCGRGAWKIADPLDEHASFLAELPLQHERGFIDLLAHGV